MHVFSKGKSTLKGESIVIEDYRSNLEDSRQIWLHLVSVQFVVDMWVWGYIKSFSRYELKLNWVRTILQTFKTGKAWVKHLEEMMQGINKAPHDLPRQKVVGKLRIQNGTIEKKGLTMCPEMTSTRFRVRVHA